MQNKLFYFRWGVVPLAALLITLSACGGGGRYDEGGGTFNMGVRSQSPAASSAASAEAYAPPADTADDYYEDSYNPPNGGGDDWEVDAEELARDAYAEAPSSGGLSGNTAPVSSRRKIITTVHLRMESKDYDRCVNNIYAAVDAAGGYIEFSDIAGNIKPLEELEPAGISATAMSAGRELALTPLGAKEYYESDTAYYQEGERRYLTMRIRVPETGLSGFLSQVEGYGNVLSKQENAEDVTLQYVDVESHKKALLAEQERLLAMLEKSVDVEAMVILEQRLSNVRYELERYESQLRVMDNQVNYATVNLTLNEVIVYTEKPEPDIPNPTVTQRISAGFMRTLEDISTYWVDRFVWVMVNIVYILGFLLVGAALVLLARRYRRLHPKAEKPVLAVGVPAGGTATVAIPTEGEGTPPTPPPAQPLGFRSGLKASWQALFIPPFHELDRMVVVMTGVHLYMAAAYPVVEDWLYYYIPSGLANLLMILGCLAFLVSFVTIPLTVRALYRRNKLLGNDSAGTPQGMFGKGGATALIVVQLVLAVLGWSIWIDMM